MDDLYDEFGNYIGPEIEEEDEDSSWQRPSNGHGNNEPENKAVESSAQADDEDEAAYGNNQIVLHEDKKFYPSAEEVYGKETEVLVEMEDSQPLTEPIIAIKKEKKFIAQDNNPAHSFSPEFLSDLMELPELIRHVAVAGAIHHGKTIILDNFIQQTHEKKWNLSKNLRYTDSLDLEQERELSIKSTPISLVMTDLRDKSYLINFIDTPGHINFADEVTAAFRVSDGVLLVVDVAEGMTSQTKRLIKHALKEHLALTLLINKMDRLVVELKLPPNDAYHKIRHLLDEINSFIKQERPVDFAQPRLSPEKGNVCFASGIHGWSFSVPSFAQTYVNTHKSSFSADSFTKRLWGDIWWDGKARKFLRTIPGTSAATPMGTARTFIQFILEPIYKLYSQVLSEEPANLKLLLEPLDIFLTPEQYKLDVLPLLKLVMSSFFGKAKCVTTMLHKFVPSPVENAAHKVQSIYTGPLSSSIGQDLQQCRADGARLLIQIVKLYAKSDGSGFNAFGRVFSGRVHANEKVKVLGESYTKEDVEDMAVATVSSCSVSQARYKIPVMNVPAGNWVLLSGVDESILKTATVTSERPPVGAGKHDSDDLYIFRPLQFNNLSTIKVAVEPLNPAELPKMLDSLRKVNKSYPLAITKAEESGEHIILGTGELYLDCVLHDLRRFFSDVEVKVADPSVSFCETVVETSSIKCYASTANTQNTIVFTAEPLERGVAESIEQGEVSFGVPQMVQFFRQKHGWDPLAARRVWAFGPDSQRGVNVLVDDTIEIDRSLLSSVKDGIVQGFQWGTREGPLCEEPIRNVKFKLLDATIASEPIYRGAGQIIPAARRVAYSSFLMATPRLMEPVFSVDIQAPEDCIPVIYDILGRRRGHVVLEEPIPGTPLTNVQAFVPVIDSFGFESDLRTHSHGQAFCQLSFDHWSIVSGDPLDKSIILKPLEPSPPGHLAREFMIKTRRRKGLMEDVSISRFFDERMLSQVMENLEI